MNFPLKVAIHRMDGRGPPAKSLGVLSTLTKINCLNMNKYNYVIGHIAALYNSRADDLMMVLQHFTFESTACVIVYVVISSTLTSKPDSRANILLLN